eukprot:747773-Hanusia_phi.AAC.10
MLMGLRDEELAAREIERDTDRQTDRQRGGDGGSGDVGADVSTRMEDSPFIPKTPTNTRYIKEEVEEEGFPAQAGMEDPGAAQTTTSTRSTKDEDEVVSRLFADGPASFRDHESERFGAAQWCSR